MREQVAWRSRRALSVFAFPSFVRTPILGRAIAADATLARARNREGVRFELIHTVARRRDVTRYPPAQTVLDAVSIAASIRAQCILDSVFTYTLLGAGTLEIEDDHRISVAVVGRRSVAEHSDAGIISTPSGDAAAGADRRYWRILTFGGGAGCAAIS